MLPQVVYTRGPLLWQGFTVLGNAVSRRKLAPRRNAPSQEYNPADRSVINRASIYGSVSVEASGTYTPQVRVTYTRLAYFIELAATCCHTQHVRDCTSMEIEASTCRAHETVLAVFWATLGECPT